MDKKEEEIREKIRSISKDKDGISVNAQDCVNELCKFFLGEDWHIVDPVNNSQANAIILYEIECRYKNSFKRKHIAGLNTFRK